MDLEIKSDKENKLMERREIDFEVKYIGMTPKSKDIAIELAKKVNSKPELIIKKMKNVFGRQILMGTAYVYKDEKARDKYTPKYILKREGLIKEEQSKEVKQQEGGK